MVENDEIQKLVHAIHHELQRPLEIRKLPAVPILAHQLDVIAQRMKQKYSGADNARIAMLVVQEFNRSGLYQRISEQPIFGPLAEERLDNPKMMDKAVIDTQSQIVDQVAQLRAGDQPYFGIDHVEGWLHFDRGKAGKQTDYRFYLSPHYSQFGVVVAALARTIPSHVRYQMKTFDHPSAQEASRLDKVIVYVREQEFSPVCSAVLQVVRDHKEAFAGRLAPGGGVVSPAPGLSIMRLDQLRKNSQDIKTGTEHIADLLSGRFDRVGERHAGRIRNEPSRTVFESQSATMVWYALLSRQKNMQALIYLGDFGVSTEETKQIKDRLAFYYLAAVWNCLINSYVSGTDLRVTTIRDRFLQYLHQHQHDFEPHYASVVNRVSSLEKTAYLYDVQIVTSIVNEAMKRAGIATEFAASLSRNQSLGDALHRLVD